MESKIVLFFKSINVILIPDRFIYLFNILWEDFFSLFLMIRKIAVIRFSHRTQCPITTSVDITFINLTTEYYV